MRPEHEIGRLPDQRTEQRDTEDAAGLPGRTTAARAKESFPVGQLAAAI